MSSFESPDQNHSESRTEAIMAHHEKPKSHFEMHIVLMEEYFLSLPENHQITEEEFKIDIKIQSDAVHRWDSDGYGAAYRKLRNDKERAKDILETTLDDVRQYIA